jgi:hypothetical protein
MSKPPFEVTLSEVLLEFVRRLYATEVESAGMSYGAKRRLARRMEIHEQSLGKMLVGAPDRQVTIGQLDAIRKHDEIHVSELLMRIFAVASALEHGSKHTDVEAIKIPGARGETYTSGSAASSPRDARPTDGARETLREAAARGAPRSPTRGRRRRSS